MVVSRRAMTRSLAVALMTLMIVLGSVGAAAAQMRTRVRYTFQSDCYRPNLGAACDKRKTGTTLQNVRLDLGPQIAVWVEKADRSQFIDTLMLTALVAERGLGNRPGHWSFPSSPKFPYGKRPMALPVWAVARGKLYDTVIMQDVTPGTIDREFWFGFHELVSSPDPYYCRPMSLPEIDVDAITCPTGVFNSAKGKLSKTEPKSYYPPRRDLMNFIPQDCDNQPGGPTCLTSARMYRGLNDIPDAVATATPAYGKAVTGVWYVPPELAEGDYALWVEINKEFDGNAAHMYPAYTDPQLSDSGLKNNFGQPSVVYRVPFRLSRTQPFQSAATDISGYGDWDGKTGTLHRPDATITDAPGSGAGRLLVFAQKAVAGGMPFVGRVHVSVEPSAAPPPPESSQSDGGAPDAPGVVVPTACVPLVAEVSGPTIVAADLAAESAKIEFFEPLGPEQAQVDHYRIRRWEGAERTAAAYMSGVAVDNPRSVAPGSKHVVDVKDLKSETTYTVGVSPTGGECLAGRMATVTFVTPTRQFTKLSGCFIATAAYGTPTEARIEVLRQWRDRVRAAGGFGAAAVSLYERSSPPIADALRQSEPGRAIVREVLGPLVGAARILQAVTVPYAPGR